VAALLPARADNRRRWDGNDTRGPLDIASIKHAHRTNDRGNRQLVHTVRLFEGWPVKRLRHQGYIHLFFQLPGHPGNPEERTLRITYDDGRLRGEMFNSLGDPPRFLAKVAVWRPNPKTVKAAFRKTLLRRRSFDAYQWSALSYVEDRHPLCNRSAGCGDWAPNVRRGKRYVRHDV